MSDCSHLRRSLLRGQHVLDIAQQLHLSCCADCALYFSNSQFFENRLERALRIPIAYLAVGKDERLLRPKRRTMARVARRSRRWLAVASILLSAIVGGVLWLAAPARSLAAAVVAHMAEEPNAWTKTSRAVATVDLQRILASAHVSLKPNGRLVSYANSCQFRGHHVPHLVLQSIKGPVTVMVLSDEKVWLKTWFDEEGYRGVLVPVPGHGALAVLERGQQLNRAEVSTIAGEVVSALDWHH